MTRLPGRFRGCLPWPPDAPFPTDGARRQARCLLDGAQVGSADFTKENHMTSKLKILVLMLFVASATAGCNTMHGAGQDIERGGEKIQEGAR